VPPVIPDQVQTRIAEVVFEDFKFDALSQVSSASMLREAGMAKNPEVSPVCQLVIESGFSFTQIVPFFDGLPLKHAAVRIDVGGKLLTNLLMEMLSHKEVNLQGETHIVNQIKESLAFVSQNFAQDLQTSTQSKFMKNPLMKEFVLPDYKNIKQGYVRDATPSINPMLLTDKELREQP